MKFKNIKFEKGHTVDVHFLDQADEPPVGEDVAGTAAYLIRDGMGEQYVDAGIIESWIDGAHQMMDEFESSVMFNEGLDPYAVGAQPIDGMGFWFTLAPQSFKTYRDKYVPGVPGWAIFAALALEAADDVTSYPEPDVESVRLAADAGRAIAYALSYFFLEAENGSHQEAGRRGGQARAAKYAAAKEYALKQANAGRYPSRRKAVQEIKDSVLEFMRKEGIPPLSPYQAEKTLDGWLKAAGYTPSSR